MLVLEPGKQPNGEVAYKSVKTALSVGYRHIDTAAAYGNEESVGRGIKDSGVARQDIFLTTKLWNEDHGYAATKKALDTSLQKLDTDYVDLYLIHWPNPTKFRDRWEEINAETWQAMEEAYADGKARAIGISNFLPHHLATLMQSATVTPAVNQNYLNPSDLQPEVQKANAAYNILNEAYSPLGTGDLFKIPELQELADKYNHSVAQIILRWSLQHGFLPLPKSIHADRIQQNTELFDFELSIPDMQKIDSLRGCGRLATNPDTAEF